MLPIMVLHVSHVAEGDIPRVQDFLRGHVETSMFLLSNLASHGHRLSDALNSGNFKLLADGNGVQGVFCLTRRGNLLAECGGRTRLASVIVDACRAEPIPIRGVVGEWRVADAIWRILIDSGTIAEVVHASREPLYCLVLDRNQAPQRDPLVRSLTPEDFDVWEPLNTAYLREEGLPVQGSLEQRRSDFADGARARTEAARDRFIGQPPRNHTFSHQEGRIGRLGFEPLLLWKHRVALGTAVSRGKPQCCIVQI